LAYFLFVHQCPADYISDKRQNKGSFVLNLEHSPGLEQSMYEIGWNALEFASFLVKTSH